MAHQRAARRREESARSSNNTSTTRSTSNNTSRSSWFSTPQRSTPAPHSTRRSPSPIRTTPASFSSSPPLPASQPRSVQESGFWSWLTRSNEAPSPSTIDRKLPAVVKQPTPLTANSSIEEVEQAVSTYLKAKDTDTLTYYSSDEDEQPLSAEEAQRRREVLKTVATEAIYYAGNPEGRAIQTVSKAMALPL